MRRHFHPTILLTNRKFVPCKQHARISGLDGWNFGFWNLFKFPWNYSSSTKKNFVEFCAVGGFRPVQTRASGKL